MSIREDIIQNYNDLCDTFEEKVTRDKYRKYGNYKTSLIDKVFGSWKDFMSEISYQVTVGRGKQIIEKTTYSDKVLITSVVDGTDINEDCLKTLLNYARINNCEFYILWGKPIKSGKFFNEKHII